MASGSGHDKSYMNEYVPELAHDPSLFSEFTPFPDAATPSMEPEMDTAPTQETGISANTGTSRPKTSDVWNHFKKIEIKEGGITKFELACLYCTKRYAWKVGEGYGTMRSHTNAKHSEKLGVPTTQKKISSYGTGAPPFHFDLSIYKEELALFISVEHLSFSFAERLGLLNFLQRGVNPQAVKVSRHTIRRTMEKLYNRDKGNMVTLFRTFNGQVHIGSDIWSDHWQTHAYMGITCHWIDDDWTLQKRILAFRVFDSRHTANNIARMIGVILDEFCLRNKVFSIGFDNASSNTASLPDLIKVCKPSFGGKFFHVRCACHVLNLCVQQGLKVLNVFLGPIKEAIQFLWSHPAKMKEWAQFCRANDKRPRRFARDVPTRWNSTYNLLFQTMGYSDLLVRFINEHAPTIILFTHSFTICEKILDVLEAFNNATLTLSGVYYPTTHLFIVEANNIVGVLDVPSFEPLEGEEEEEATSRKLLARAMELMREKWLQYYQEIPIIYLVACVFDPRIKLDGLYDYLIAYYTSLHVCSEVNVRNIVEEVRKQIIDIYNEFFGRINVDVGGSSSIDVVNEPQKNKKRGWNILHLRLKKNKGSVTTSSTCSELDAYLHVAFEFCHEDDADFDILAWWKNHANQYPILSAIAKQVLATPCSTVAVEQAFSAGGNILDESRSNLLPDSLEMQTCLDDWTKAKYRQQEIDRANFQFFDDDDGTTTTASEA